MNLRIDLASLKKPINSKLAKRNSVHKTVDKIEAKRYKKFGSISTKNSEKKSKSKSKNVISHRMPKFKGIYEVNLTCENRSEFSQSDRNTMQPIDTKFEEYRSMVQNSSQSNRKIKQSDPEEEIVEFIQ